MSFAAHSFSHPSIHISPHIAPFHPYSRMPWLFMPHSSHHHTPMNANERMMMETVQVQQDQLHPAIEESQMPMGIVIIFIFILAIVFALMVKSFND